MGTARPRFTKPDRVGKPPPRFTKQDQVKSSVKEALDAEVCIICGMPAMPRCTTSVGIERYKVTAKCEVCYDSIKREMKEEGFKRTTDF